VRIFFPDPHYINYINSKDEVTLKALTTADYATKVNKIVRTRKPSQVWQWRVLSDVSDKALFQKKSCKYQDYALQFVLWIHGNLVFRAPAISPGATIVSIRSGEVYIAKEPPKRGNRLVIHALVKFETTQVSILPACVNRLWTNAPPGIRGVHQAGPASRS
jgi:hypothetical protein